MSNKTSDKNVANDIKILKKFCEYEEAVVLTDNALEEVQDAMQNILAEREQMLKAINTVEKEKGDWIKAYQEEKDSQFDLLKRIKELEEENLIQRKQIMNIFDNDYIPTQVVIDKIKEIKRLRDKCITTEGYNIANGEVVVLQELLEGERK